MRFIAELRIKLLKKNQPTLDLLKEKLYTVNNASYFFKKERV